MNNTIFILVAVFSLLSVKAGTVNSNNDSSIYNLFNLGQVDGKHYFHEVEITSRNWAAAGNYCEKSGMQLARIETRAQADFLKSKYGYSGFRGAYWTAGRDALLPRQFTWNTTGKVPTDISRLTWNLNVYTKKYQTCVMYFAYSSPELQIFSCDKMSSAVLCQT